MWNDDFRYDITRILTFYIYVLGTLSYWIRREQTKRKKQLLKNAKEKKKNQKHCFLFVSRVCDPRAKWCFFTLHTQHPVISVRWAVVDWSWPKKWNWSAQADLHLKKRKVQAGNELSNLPPTSSQVKKSHQPNHIWHYNHQFYLVPIHSHHHSDNHSDLKFFQGNTRDIYAGMVEHIGEVFSTWICIPSC